MVTPDDDGRRLRGTILWDESEEARSGESAHRWLASHFSEVASIQAIASLVFAALRSGPHRRGDMTRREIDKAERYYNAELDRLGAKGATGNLAHLLARSLSAHSPPSDPIELTDVLPVEVEP